MPKRASIFGGSGISCKSIEYSAECIRRLAALRHEADLQVDPSATVMLTDCRRVDMFEVLTFLRMKSAETQDMVAPVSMRQRAGCP